MSKWGVLAVLGAAQFLMVLDQAVMNVSISQLVADFDTTVTTIQIVIALYALVMASLMLTGGKLGDLWGRKRAFTIGLVIYACGSALTAASWSVPTLMLGWSILEGIGAALVLPALVALVAGNYQGQDRAIAYGVLGGVAGAGIAVGPILGGWATTELSWRVVFAGEVVVAIGILIGMRLVREPARAGRAPKLDWVGSVLTATGPGADRGGSAAGQQLGLARPAELARRALRVLAHTLCGRSRLSGAGSISGLGASPGADRARSPGPPPPVPDPPAARRPLDAAGPEPDPDGDLLHRPAVPADSAGADALETGVRMLPASAGLFIAALLGSSLATRFAARPLVRVGLGITLLRS